VTFRALLITLWLEAAFWTFAIREAWCKTYLARSRHFFSLCALSADLRSLSAFHFIAQLTLGICITFTLAASVFTAAHGNFLQTKSTVVPCVLGVMLYFAIFAFTQFPALLGPSLSKFSRVAGHLFAMILTLVGYCVETHSSVFCIKAEPWKLQLKPSRVRKLWAFIEIGTVGD